MILIDKSPKLNDRIDTLENFMTLQDKFQYKYLKRSSKYVNLFYKVTKPISISIESLNL